MGVLEKFSASQKHLFNSFWIQNCYKIMVRAKLTQKRYYESGSEEDSEDEVASRPPAKKKANQKVSQPRKIIYKDDVSESESEPEEADDDSDFGAKKDPQEIAKKEGSNSKKRQE